MDSSQHQQKKEDKPVLSSCSSKEHHGEHDSFLAQNNMPQCEQSKPAYLVFINELPFQDICGGSMAGIKKHFNE